MPSPTLPKTAKNSHSQKRDRGNTSPRQQLDLFNKKPSVRKQSAKSVHSAEPLQTPAIAAKLAPASWHRSKRDRYWIFIDCLGGQYGGLFYRPEVDYILAHFKGRIGLIERSEFDPVAEQAVSIFTKRVGVAA